MKFKFGNRVRVISGFYQGTTGKCVASADYDSYGWDVGEDRYLIKLDESPSEVWIRTEDMESIREVEFNPY